MEVKDLKFEDIKVGDSAEFEQIVTLQDMEDFARLSGNWNPLHTDLEYARKTKFSKPIVYGMLLGALTSKLFGMYIPGQRALCLSQTLNFHQAVYPGEQIRVRGEVRQKSESTRILEIYTTITNNQGEQVLDGEAKVQVLSV